MVKVQFSYLRTRLSPVLLIVVFLGICLISLIENATFAKAAAMGQTYYLSSNLIIA